MPNNLLDLSNDEFKKELYKENIFIELSERLELEMNSRKINVSELSNFLGKEEFYVNSVLDGLLDLKISEVAYIFAFFDKFVGVVPVSKDERIQINNVKEHSFMNFDSSTGKVKLCTKSEFKKNKFDVVHSFSLGVIPMSDRNNLSILECNNINIESKKVYSNFTSILETDKSVLSK